MANIRVVKVPVETFAIKLVDKRKLDCGVNTANAGFFGTYHEDNQAFTLPAGHLICDFAADGKWTRHYCEERGTFNGEKFSFNCAEWSYQNALQGKTLSTLVVRGGKATVEDTVSLPSADYAISGVPVIRNGEKCSWSEYVTKQGWSSSTARSTWHTLIGIKDNPTVVYVIGMESTTSNLVSSSEAYDVFMPMGFRELLKLDGGGSFYFNVDGTISATQENRRINTILAFEGTEERMFKIALGAGHGSRTSGKRCLKSLDPKETREWWLNDRICDFVESYLKEYTGYELLRLDDSDDGSEDVALNARVDAANKWNADFYLSVHHNAGPNPPSEGGTWSGIVAFSHPQAGKGTHEWRDALYDALIRHTGLKGNRSSPKATSNLQVLRTTKMPAVLLELGFMDSKIDVPIILSDEYARNCAKAIVEVLVQRGKLTKKPQADVVTRWKVQVGSFAKKENADKLCAELKSKGYQPYITKA